MSLQSQEVIEQLINLVGDEEHQFSSAIQAEVGCQHTHAHTNSINQTLWLKTKQHMNLGDMIEETQGWILSNKWNSEWNPQIKKNSE